MKKETQTTTIEIESCIKKVLKISPILFVLLLIVMLLLVVLTPFLFIWAINTLNLASIQVAYTPLNWLASLVVLALFGNVKASISR